MRFVALQLRAHVNEALLDQIPALAPLQRYLEELSFMEPPAPRSDLLLEQAPEIRDKLIAESGGSRQWKAIAADQLKRFFKLSAEEKRAQATRLAATYDLDALESVLPTVCSRVRC